MIKNYRNYQKFFIEFKNGLFYISVLDIIFILLIQIFFYFHLILFENEIN